MAIATTKITDDQARRILALEETHFADIKAIDIAPSKLTRTVSAFSNASGGELYVGVDEAHPTAGKHRSWRGFADTEAANPCLQVFEHLFPLGQYYSYTFLACDLGPGLVLQVNVNKTREITKASDGVPYVRRGAQNLAVTTAEALARLRLDKGITSFEGETVDVPPDTVTNSVPILEFLVNVIPTAEPEAWLQKQQLLRGGKPTVAAVLLFGEEPQAVLPKRCGVKIYRYPNIWGGRNSRHSRL